MAHPLLQLIINTAYNDGDVRLIDDDGNPSFDGALQARFHTLVAIASINHIICLPGLHHGLCMHAGILS